MDEIEPATTDPSATPLARCGQIAALVAFLAVLISPYPADLPSGARRAAAVAAAMGVLWLTQAIPLGATSLIPLAAFPLLGVQSAKDVSKGYINENVFLYLGGFVIALGIERWGLHRRMALHVIRVVGVGPRRIVLGFALATGFLSMWMSNTAATMMMIPIAFALLRSLDELAPGSAEAPSRKGDELGTAVMLAVAYAATIGGMTTLVGTPTNGVYRQVFTASFPDAPPISSGQWMASFVPLGVVFLIVMWLLLTARLKAIPGAERLERSFFTARLRELGPPMPAERRMLVVFGATALLWLFQTPFSLSGSGESEDALIPGWGPLVADGLVALGVPEDAAGRMVSDSTVAMVMATLLFLIPAGRARPELEEPQTGAKANLMDWPTANKLPWEVLLLFGGGFALADGFEKTGLSVWIGERFGSTLGGQPVWLVIAATCLLLTFLSEFASNVATANIVLPILAPAAIHMGMDPRLVMVAATLAASCGFMLPAATPPNALAFTSGRVTARQMARKGFALDLIGSALVTAAVLWIYAPLAGIEPGKVPEWAVLKESAPPR